MMNKTKKHSATERFAQNIKKALDNYYEQHLVQASDLKKSKVQDTPLPPGFINRVIAYKAILKEVETSDLETTINNFQRDLYPEYELGIWEGIAESYQRGLEIMDNPSPEEKQDWFKQLLASSLGVN